MRPLALLMPLAFATWLGAVAATAQEKKPSVPPGRDPGGVAIALISTGIDYTLPAVAQRLARDGEGELIGWDLEDRDRRPFDRRHGAAPMEWGGDATLVASLLVSTPGVRLVPVRVDPVTPLSLARALAFVAQTPARVAVLPIAAKLEGDWTPFRDAATHFKGVLIIAPAGISPEPAFRAALALENVVAVQHGAIGAEAAGFGGNIRQVTGAPVAVAAAAGTAALMLSQPSASVNAVKGRLSESGGGTTWQAQK